MKINSFVDIHSHILPGLDDGADNAAESVEMLKIAYEQGIRTIIASPHFGKYSNQHNTEMIGRVATLMQKSVEDSCPGLEILTGNEIYYSSKTVNYLEKGKALTLAESDYVLIEFNFNIDYATILAATRELKTAGYKPIIAHAERYICMAENISKVKELHQEGAFIQVNSGMLLNPPEDFSKKGFLTRRLHLDPIELFKKSAWDLMRADQVDFIASDTHDTSYRKPVMKDALEIIEGEFGIERVEKLIINSKRIKN